MSKNDWKDEWIDMPEYNNIEFPPPAITVTFKFLNQEDYNEFYKIIKKHLFPGEKPFDGGQRKNSKTTWYPHKEKASNYIYVNEDES